MGELFLVGLGLTRKLVTQMALEVLKSSDVVLFDTYTSFSCDITVDWLKSLGINIVPAERRDLENEYMKIIEALSQGKRIAVATIGDPVVATTHIALATEAAKRGHKVKIVPGVSVLCYFLSKTGLSSYKLGRSVTVTFPENLPSEYPYRVIKENDSLNLHTPVFLDISGGKMMTAKEAIRILTSLEERFKEGVITPDRYVVVGQRLGCDDERVDVLKVSEVEEARLADPPHILLFPSRRLHFVEEEGLEWIRRRLIG